MPSKHILYMETHDVCKNKKFYSGLIYILLDWPIYSNENTLKVCLIFCNVLQSPFIYFFSFTPPPIDEITYIRHVEKYIFFTTTNITSSGKNTQIITARNSRMVLKSQRQYRADSQYTIP